MSTIIPRTQHAPALDADAWPAALQLDIASFHPESSEHRPHTRVSLLHDGEAIYIRFDVDDRYVRAVAQQHQEMVCRDSCVEAFLQPVPGRGYINFEFNCGGTMLAYHVHGQFRQGQYTPVADEWLQRIDVFATLPRIVEPEISDPVQWRLAARLPLALFEQYFDQPRGSQWRGNFFKCGDETSHPHWASWQPVGDKLDFHQPEKFGYLTLERFSSVRPGRTA